MGFGIKPDHKGIAEPPVNIGDNPAVTPIEKPVLPSPDEKLQKKKYVADTFHNRVGVNTRRFVDVIADLKGFAEGAPVKVIYYKEHYSETDVLGRHHTEESMHVAHKSVLKIIDFEMRMTNSLSYEYDAENHISKASGEAFTYPGFEPEMGDRLVMEVGDGLYGCFEVNEPPTRTSIRASTYFKIKFDFVHWCDEEYSHLLDEGVVDTAYFDKARFLNEPGALLHHGEVIEMTYMNKQCSKMIHYYEHKFLDKLIMYSYMRPDKVYDPYVTDFLMAVLEFSEAGTAVMQLYNDAPFKEVSIWRALLDANVPLEAVPSASVRALYSLGSKSVLANSLLNRYYVKLIKSKSLKDYLKELFDEYTHQDQTPGEDTPGDQSIPQLTPCEDVDKILGDLLLHIHPHYCECPWVNGEDEDGAGGTTDSIGYILGDGEFFFLMYYFLMTRKIVDLKVLHRAIEGVWKLSPIEQFYRMPILIYLCKVVVGRIHRIDNVFFP